VKSLKLKFETVAEKTEKNFRGLLYFAAPGIHGACFSCSWNRQLHHIDIHKLRSYSVL